MSASKPKRRRVDKTGRSAPLTKFAAIQLWMMQSPAWQAIGPYERTILVELNGLYNGRNNGELFLSCREAARRCNMDKDRANQAFKKLREMGFIRYRSEDLGHFTERNARCWILTEFSFLGREPTKDFMNWRPAEKSKSRLDKGTARPKNGTVPQLDATRSEQLSGKRDGKGRYCRQACPESGTQLSSHIGPVIGSALN